VASKRAGPLVRRAVRRIWARPSTTKRADRAE
jgi:hypothetical protein